MEIRWQFPAHSPIHRNPIEMPIYHSQSTVIILPTPLLIDRKTSAINQDHATTNKQILLATTKTQANVLRKEMLRPNAHTDHLEKGRVPTMIFPGRK